MSDEGAKIIAKAINSLAFSIFWGFLFKGCLAK